MFILLYQNRRFIYKIFLLDILRFSSNFQYIFCIMIYHFRLWVLKKDLQYSQNVSLIMLLRIAKRLFFAIQENILYLR